MLKLSLSRIALPVMVLSLATTAAAQTSVNRFRASETPDDAFAISRATDYGHKRLGIQVYGDYANDPLVVELNQAGSDETLAVIEHQLTTNFGLSFGLFDRLVIFGGLPVHFVMDSEEDLGLVNAVEPEGAGLGDAYLGARFRLFGEQADAFALALQATVTAPTAELFNDDQLYSGDDIFTFHPEALAELRFGKFRINLNPGVRVRVSDQPVITTEASTELTAALGFAYSVVESKSLRLDLHAQGYGATSVNDVFDKETTALEVIGGAKAHLKQGLVFGAAAGPGLAEGYGSPDVRIIATVGWGTPADMDGDGLSDRHDRCPEDPEDKDGFEDRDGCPDLDNDSDGIPDTQDKCDNDPEDEDGFQDQDGCPDPDNDNDGVLDGEDKCPTDAEDRDDFEDTDGCPDTDNDGDSVADVNDKCPMEKEDVDGFEDEDGCPDTDNDDDGILDAQDNCATVAGPMENRGCPDTDRDEDGVLDRMDNCPDKKGTEENHGCPKKEKQLVVITKERLEILDKVYFNTGRARIQRRSFPLLDNVARVILAHPEIGRIRVEGHTDSKGRAAKNLRLSQQRADSVVRYLVKKGVPLDRIFGKGYGQTQPVDTNDTRQGRANNRRVEFKLENTETTSTQSQVAPEEAGQ